MFEEYAVIEGLKHVRWDFIPSNEFLTSKRISELVGMMKRQYELQWLMSDTMGRDLGMYFPH